ncbi:UPF0575 protein C19orf67 homolog isoform X2 [Nothobranchius furzeri]|uniref:Transcript variant X2 n=1 Tax=Nothobranchius furzeri TaxID=105023 RepID=A0A9D2XBH6_NOTFU|nr:transcript variant X2 [Nothobranchius furzeri]
MRGCGGKSSCDLDGAASLVTDAEDEPELPLDISPLPGHDAFTDLLQEDVSDINSPDPELEDPLLFLAEVALAPHGCRFVSSSSPEVKQTENLLLTFQRQLQQFLSKADELHDCLISGQGYVEKEAFSGAVSSLLYTCRPYFDYLETTARSTLTQYSHLSFDMRSKLLDFSQQLCEKLEQLVLTFSDHGLVSVDETEPNSISHFCIGQTHLDRLKLSGFRYCKPTPYLSQSKTGLYKRMRWNVERPHDKQQREEDDEDAEDKTHTDYYFLCYEDIPNAHAEAGGGRDGVTHGDVVRMWSIGQWVQVNPDPKTEDLEDWILCEVPEGSYRRLLCLGQDEPSSRTATDHLQQLLLSCQPD